jgi:hypothetical protein
MTTKEHFVYTPASTDVSIRWRQLYNYVPPSEDPVYQRKWAEFRALAIKGIESIEKPKPIYSEKILKLRNTHAAS